MQRFHLLIVHDFYVFGNPTVLCLSSHKDKKEIANKVTRTNYDLVRRALKHSLEQTGFITVFLFEDDFPSTSSAEEDYINKIDECHVCLFLAWFKNIRN
jgi:hypothetical protein